jgi:hypothetical protein
LSSCWGAVARNVRATAIAAAKATWADYKHAKSRGTGTERNSRKKWR